MLRVMAGVVVRVHYLAAAFFLETMLGLYLVESMRLLLAKEVAVAGGNAVAFATPVRACLESRTVPFRVRAHAIGCRS